MEFVLARSQKMMMMIALGIGHSGTSAGIPGTSLVITLADEHIDTMFRDATLARRIRNIIHHADSGVRAS